MSWDVFDAVLTPGNVILLLSWHDQGAAEAFEAAASLGDDLRLRRARVVRDYGMFDRRESPQYYPDVSITPMSNVPDEGSVYRQRQDLWSGSPGWIEPNAEPRSVPFLVVALHHHPRRCVSIGT
jgi:hypothetical protein